jgi:lipopolysaccharide heptosyltransferase II
LPPKIFYLPLLENRTCVALNLGASHPVNRWPVERFASLADRLTKEMGAVVLLVGGNDDRELADGVLAQLTTPVVDLVGRTSLTELGGVLQRCKLAVSADTGPLHLATAVGTPVIALFGAADPERTGPVGEGHLVIQANDLTCVPCRSRSCNHTPYLECMSLITVDEVMLAVGKLLDSSRVKSYSAAR